MKPTDKTNKFSEKERADKTRRLNKEWQVKNSEYVKAARKVRRNAWRKNNREEYLESRRQWYRKNAGRISIKTKAQHATNPKKYAMHKAETYVRNQIKLTGRKKPKLCDICHKTGRICYDHCHKSGLFRGWICHRCNVALGYARDSAKLLRKLADYLDAYKIKPKISGAVAKAQKVHAAKKAARAAQNKEWLMHNKKSKK